MKWFSLGACFLLLILFSQRCLAQPTSMETYRLGSGDRVQILVYGQDDLTVETRLSDIGVLNYPYLGEIKVTGKTISELESLIYNGLKGDYLVSPSVSVSILEYRPFFINGEVKTPGSYSFQPALTVDKAAAIAGGYTERASKQKITIVREDQGERVEILAEPTTVVLPGDIVNIKQSFF